MLKYPARGVYVFPRLTLLGFENTDHEFRKLEEVTKYDFDDSDKRNEGVEVKNISPFELIRDLARHLNYEPVKVVETEAPGVYQDDDDHDDDDDDSRRQMRPGVDPCGAGGWEGRRGHRGGGRPQQRGWEHVDTVTGFLSQIIIFFYFR